MHMTVDEFHWIAIRGRYKVTIAFRQCKTLRCDTGSLETTCPRSMHGRVGLWSGLPRVSLVKANWAHNMLPSHALLDDLRAVSGGRQSCLSMKQAKGERLSPMPAIRNAIQWQKSPSLAFRQHRFVATSAAIGETPFSPTPLGTRKRTTVLRRNLHGCGLL